MSTAGGMREAAAIREKFPGKSGRFGMVARVIRRQWLCAAAPLRDARNPVEHSRGTPVSATFAHCP
jgi:hypothetical protein